MSTGGLSAQVMNGLATVQAQMGFGQPFHPDGQQPSLAHNPQGGVLQWQPQAQQQSGLAPQQPVSASPYFASNTQQFANAAQQPSPQQPGFLAQEQMHIPKQPANIPQQPVFTPQQPTNTRQQPVISGHQPSPVFSSGTSAPMRTGLQPGDEDWGGNAQGSSLAVQSNPHSTVACGQHQAGRTPQQILGQPPQAGGFASTGQQGRGGAQPAQQSWGQADRHASQPVIQGRTQEGWGRGTGSGAQAPTGAVQLLPQAVEFLQAIEHRQAVEGRRDWGVEQAAQGYNNPADGSMPANENQPNSRMGAQQQQVWGQGTLTHNAVSQQSQAIAAYNANTGLDEEQALYGDSKPPQMTSRDTQHGSGMVSPLCADVKPVGCFLRSPHICSTWYRLRCKQL